MASTRGARVVLLVLAVGLIGAVVTPLALQSGVGSEMWFYCHARGTCLFAVVSADGTRTSHFEVPSNQRHDLPNDFSGGNYCVVVAEGQADVLLKDWPPRCANVVTGESGRIFTGVKAGGSYNDAAARESIKVDLHPKTEPPLEVTAEGCEKQSRHVEKTAEGELDTTKGGIGGVKGFDVTLSGVTPHGLTEVVRVGNVIKFDFWGEGLGTRRLASTDYDADGVPIAATYMCANPGPSKTSVVVEAYVF